MKNIIDFIFLICFSTLPLLMAIEMEEGIKSELHYAVWLINYSLGVVVFISVIRLAEIELIEGN